MLGQHYALHDLARQSSHVPIQQPAQMQKVTAEKSSKSSFYQIMKNERTLKLTREEQKNGPNLLGGHDNPKVQVYASLLLYRVLW